MLQATESDRVGLLRRALAPAAGEQAGSTRTIDRAQRSVFEMLGSAERAHAARVRTFSTAVARMLGLDDSTTRAISVAGALHDVGKVFVPPAILTKTEPLTRADWVVIRRHPTVGAAALAPAVRRPEVLEIVRAHHERWDGQGYPDRSRGGDTPLGARIVGVVDAFAAMTERRCYRRPLGIEEAAADLRTNSGTQFVPTVSGRSSGSCSGGASRLRRRGRRSPFSVALCARSDRVTRLPPAPLYPQQPKGAE